MRNRCDPYFSVCAWRSSTSVTDSFACKEPMWSRFFICFLSLNWTGPVLRAMSTNEHRPSRDYRETQLDLTFFISEVGRTCTTRRRFLGQIQGGTEHTLRHSPATQVQRRSVSARLETFLFFVFRFFLLCFLYPFLSRPSVQGSTHHMHKSLYI